MQLSQPQMRQRSLGIGRRKGLTNILLQHPDSCRLQCCHAEHILPTCFVALLAAAGARTGRWCPWPCCKGRTQTGPRVTPCKGAVNERNISGAPLPARDATQYCHQPVNSIVHDMPLIKQRCTCQQAFTCSSAGAAGGGTGARAAGAAGAASCGDSSPSSSISSCTKLIWPAQPLHKWQLCSRGV